MASSDASTTQSTSASSQKVAGDPDARALSARPLQVLRVSASIFLRSSSLPASWVDAGHHAEAAATSATLRAIGPPVSKLSASGMMPLRLRSPCVGLSPAMPFEVAGPRIDPAGVVPMPSGAKPRQRRRPSAGGTRRRSREIVRIEVSPPSDLYRRRTQTRRGSPWPE